MSPTDLAPYTPAAIAFVGTLLGGVIAAMSGLLQAKPAQRAMRQDTWTKICDEYQRLTWAEYTLAYCQLLSQADRLNTLIRSFSSSVPAKSAEIDEYILRLQELARQFDENQAAYWRVYATGQQEVITAAMEHFDKQREIVITLCDRKPYDENGLNEAFNKLAQTICVSLREIPDSMRKGMESVGITS